MQAAERQRLKAELKLLNGTGHASWWAKHNSIGFQALYDMPHAQLAAYVGGLFAGAGLGRGPAGSACHSNLPCVGFCWQCSKLHSAVGCAGNRNLLVVQQAHSAVGSACHEHTACQPVMAPQSQTQPMGGATFSSTAATAPASPAPSLPWGATVRACCTWCRSCWGLAGSVSGLEGKAPEGSQGLQSS